MPDMDFEVLIIGGGVVGLAIAAKTAQKYAPIALLERHDSFGQETSSRNSEVVHAGMYYKTGSLKARLCLEGRRELYQLAEQHHIPYKKSGKIVIALSEFESISIEELKLHGEANGVEGLRMLTPEETKKIEPNVSARAALFSPETGIIDSHRLMDIFRRIAKHSGADLVFGAAVSGLAPVSGGWEVRYFDAEGEGTVTARTVVNAAGLHAQDVMRMAGLKPDAMNLTLHLCKGEYFSVQGQKRKMVNGLVYPPPHADLVSLGIHTRVDLGGTLRLGPSAFYVDKIDYTVDPVHKSDFLSSVKPFLPFLEIDDLSPDMAGIRPKLAGPGEPARDFHIAHEAEHGAPGFFNLVGIESPGLTASPAIAGYILSLLSDYLS